tara:strand:- start:222 stop:1154 length:933 start_codon:yes stop_codon:yes gene_type:complete
MAVRKPLYNNSGNLQEMTTTMVADVVKQAVYQYSTDPSVVLSVVGSGGSLNSLSDTRLQAGGQSTSSTSAPGEGTTAEPSIVTVTYDKLTLTSTPGSDTTDTGKSFPVFLDGSNNIQAMSKQDMLDTFIHPAIDLLTSASTTSEQAGTYQISNSNSVSGNTLVSGTPIFVDTRADTSLYTAGSIPETQDQPKDISSYYLHRIDGVDNSYTLPVKVRTDNNLQIFPESDFETLIKNMTKYAAASGSGSFSITYQMGGGTGASRGTGIVDTRLDGSGNYQTRFVNADDYRAQEFPNGTAQTISTTFLKIYKY